MSTPTSLKIGPISYVPFDSYPKDFTFVVNHKEYRTNKLIADLLSKKISKIHLTDPTIDKYEVITKCPGYFQQILDLLKVDNLDINPSEVPFFTEIAKTLEIDINIKIPKADKLTIDNVLELIHAQENYENYFSHFLIEEIEFVSKNFFKLKESHEDSLLSLSPSTIQHILSSDSLCLESEDQLLDFVNKLYFSDRSLSCFYDFVNFTNVGNEALNQFASVFSTDDITGGTWSNIISSLLNRSKVTKTVNRRYATSAARKTQSSSRSNSSNKNGPKEYFPFTGTEFEGIFNHFRLMSEINLIVKVKASSDGCGFDIEKLLKCDNLDFSFYTRDIQNSWISFTFVEFDVSLTHYTIRSDKWNKVGGNHPRSWVIEGSNGHGWDVIDTRVDDGSLNGPGIVHTFKIQENPGEIYYSTIRMRLFDTNWNSKNYLLLNAIEFYGSIQW